MTDQTALSPNAVTIRPAKAADELVIARLWGQLMAEMCALDARQPRPSPGADRLYAGRLVQSLSDEFTCVFVAEHSKEYGKPSCVVGYVLAALISGSDLFVSDVSGFIVDLYVDQKVRRGGVGRLLVISATGWLQSRGVMSIALNVDSENTVGQTFWKSLGGTPRQTRMHIDLRDDLTDATRDQQGVRS